MTIRFLRGLRVTRAIIEFFPLLSSRWNRRETLLMPLGLPRRRQLAICVQ